MSIGGRHKGIPTASRTIKENGKTRFSKEDYQKMVEDKSIQNMAMSKNIRFIQGQNIRDPVRLAKVQQQMKDKRK